MYKSPGRDDWIVDEDILQKIYIATTHSAIPQSRIRLYSPRDLDTVWPRSTASRVERTALQFICNRRSETVRTDSNLNANDSI